MANWPRYRSTWDRTVEGLAGMAMLLVNPGVAVPTGQVFAGWDRQDRGALDAGSLKALIEAGRNDLQASAIAVAPVIAQVLTCLETQSGLTLARMSGSGATCFALFEDDAALADAAMAVRIAYPDWWVMETRIGAA